MTDKMNFDLKVDESKPLLLSTFSTVKVNGVSYFFNPYYFRDNGDGTWGILMVNELPEDVMDVLSDMDAQPMVGSFPSELVYRNISQQGEQC